MATKTHFLLSTPPKPPCLPLYPSSSSLPSKPRSFSISFCLSINQSRNDQTASSSSTASKAPERVHVAFAAGGTGGHIYPAVAIADELKLVNPTCKVLFLGCPDSMESTAIPSAHFEFKSIPAVQLARPFSSPQNLFLPYRLIKSIIKSYTLLSKFEPHIVIGTGGYVSFPVCLAALLQRTKLVIQEQNSVPGIANWVLSFFADLVFVAFNSTVECFPRKEKCVVCGNPVRLSLKGLASKAVSRLHFFPELAKMEGSSEEVKVILVLGGSLGANAVNIALLNVYSQLLLEHKNWFIIWQTGVESFNEMESLVRNHRQLLLTPFLHSMELAYAAADLIISRAGAMTCSEILATGKPSILIPSPNVAEGHQFRNASLMADVAGSMVITEDELDSTTLGTAISEILGDENLLTEMSERALKAAKLDASAEIAKHILSLVNLSAVKEKQ
ncbi:PREDICTED: UDP-N-acetylglucosamine--N-acetylmuramyl-(pentapeptide) pyrophosphoryl-undecaprenol N-acetylglucosamine transferase [Theobroma cacao]|uniref:UDP-N-acetylglucosamine--N-acetylmuramyl- (Pentapeptide) pyrophosphoryl-undecaprenol N-acetylglucosamine transferase n=1 Tax=Theobroma cacao TaxID=3641 RepID=A0AB32W8Y6_THECC|nr:PREDICTED: UDP-N-acetylglucosamine--N-acetylmuramyl-(pentapeptide) pyrophosphoryl-undecaprenol N-acetylglucosamine transferase [Theobroma cacao]